VLSIRPLIPPVESQTFSDQTQTVTEQRRQTAAAVINDDELTVTKQPAVAATPNRYGEVQAHQRAIWRQVIM